MKPRLISVNDVALAVAEIVDPFNQQRQRLMEVHLFGDAEDIKALASKLGSIVLGRAIMPADLTSGLHTAPNRLAIVGFIDEAKRQVLQRPQGEAMPTIEELALPISIREATRGILLIANPQENRLYYRPDSVSIFSQPPQTTLHDTGSSMGRVWRAHQTLKVGPTKPNLEIKIKGNESGVGLPSVRMHAGGLPNSVRKKFKAAIDFAIR